VPTRPEVGGVGIQPFAQSQSECLAVAWISPREQIHETNIKSSDELRLLARGLYPEILNEEGLRPALLALGETSPVRIGALPKTRLPAVLETTAYLLVATAARSGPTDVSGDALEGVFRLELRAQAPEVDVSELADRVAALHGELRVETDDEGRQHLHLRLPTP
jgi:hypothetical protein